MEGKLPNNMSKSRAGTTAASTLLAGAFGAAFLPTVAVAEEVSETQPQGEIVVTGQRPDVNASAKNPVARVGLPTMIVLAAGVLMDPWPVSNTTPLMYTR